MRKKWPQWPEFTNRTISKVTNVIESRRWAISGMNVGNLSEDRKLAKKYSTYCDVKHAIPTCNGSSALKIALESIGIGVNDEVIVPSLTWVATVSAVNRVNATPIFVDIDPASLCISPDLIENAITNNTKVIMPVHLYSNMADMDKINSIAKKYNVKVIEDCSHAHGAEWDHKKSGTIGDIGVFSMQQTKLLTCGEGGIAITNDSELANNMEQLRADSRVFKRKYNKNEMDLEEIGNLQGANYCLSEIHSAILNDRIDYLDAENDKRYQNSKILNSILAHCKYIETPKSNEKLTKQVFYKFVIKLVNIKYSYIDEICNELKELTKVNFARLYQPLNNNILYNPKSKKSILPNTIVKFKDENFHNAIEAYKTHICFPHEILLANNHDIEELGSTIVEFLERLYK